MESKATLRYNRQSPYKVRKVLNSIRGCNVGTAINYLHFSPEKASVAIEKTIRSAVANLMQNEDSKDIDYRLNTLNRNVNLIIKKMNQSQFFDDESQDNIHDLILFMLFGIFIIFVLDTIYRFGKKSSSSNY